MYLRKTKTEGMWIGALKGSLEKPYGIKWPSEPINSLGTLFTYDQSLLYEKNFQDKVDSKNKLTNVWPSRELSINGKVTIIKSLLIPKLVYMSSVLSPPCKIIKQVNCIIYFFYGMGKIK